MRHLVTSIPLVALPLLLSGCERLVGPPPGARGERPRFGDYVLPVGAVDAPTVLHRGDTITVRLTSLDPSSCVYGQSQWLVLAFRAYIVPYGVRAGNPRCPPLEVRMPSPAGSNGLAPQPPAIGEQILPARIVVCQPESDPLTTVSSVPMTVHTEEGRTYYVALKRQLLADLESGEALRVDRALCAKMIAMMAR
jgi:hypothetical protein